MTFLDLESSRSSHLVSGEQLQSCSFWMSRHLHWKPAQITIQLSTSTMLISITPALLCCVWSVCMNHTGVSRFHGWSWCAVELKRRTLPRASFYCGPVTVKIGEEEEEDRQTQSERRSHHPTRGHNERGLFICLLVFLFLVSFLSADAKGSSCHASFLVFRRSLVKTQLRLKMAENLWHSLNHLQPITAVLCALSARSLV